MELLTIILDVNPLAWNKRQANLDSISIKQTNNATVDSIDHDSTITSSPCQHTFHQTLNDLIIFINAFTLLNTRNQLSIIASHTQTAEFIYPSSSSRSSNSNNNSINDNDDSRTSSSDSDDAMRPPESIESESESIHETITRNIQQILTRHAHQTARQSQSSTLPISHLSAALSLSLLHAHRLKKQYPKMRVRTLVLQVQDNTAPQPQRNSQMMNAQLSTVNSSANSLSRSQNLALMNCIFSAQKASHTIDACIFNTSPQNAVNQQTINNNNNNDTNASNTSELITASRRSNCEHLLLQQASALTGGCYSRPTLHGPSPDSLLQTLFHLYLSDSSIRQFLVLPLQSAIDYRATCFCHSAVVDTASVCPVCLAIFCRATPVCPVCNTKFPAQRVAAATAANSSTSSAAAASATSAAAHLRRQRMAQQQKTQQQANGLVSSSTQVANSSSTTPDSTSTSAQSSAVASAASTPRANSTVDNSNLVVQ